MSDVPVMTRQLWHVTDAQWVDTDPEVDVIAVALQCNGKNYVVACSGPKAMQSDEFIPAIRAAAAALLRENGGDITVINRDAGSTFDTGDQRAN